MDHSTKKERQKNYTIFWRWHFYAGIILAPILLMLAVTGASYLFRGDIEDWLYQDYTEVSAEGNRHEASVVTQAVLDERPEAHITRYQPPGGEGQAAEVGITTASEEGMTVFVNPYTLDITGTLLNKNRLMDRVQEFHGELMIGTTGDRIVETAACWTIFMLISGLYLWWPSRSQMVNRKSFLPGPSDNKRQKRKRIHSVPAFWISGGLVFFLLTGMLWTGFWGDGVQRIATSTGIGYPPSIWVGEAPVSDAVTTDTGDVSWAAEQMPVPESYAGNAYERISIDHVVNTAEQTGVVSGFNVYYPSSETGVFTVSAFPDQAQNEVTMHINQYNGSILADYRWEQYPLPAKVMAMGITIHKGLQFGIWNQLFGLLICVGLIGIILSGIRLWWTRRPAGKLGAPKSMSAWKFRGFVFLVIGFGIVFPLFGLSVLILYALDYLIIRRISRLRTFFHMT
ncbi:PepSY-associated TM helix domain-containing protein [Salibacterium lacus]|uniref:PepSY-associated TM helix domain-containing protein n=1 Tax=Salibacterium lacus TaxID=1898109 RepID=A0ABW5T4A7_9BACI